MEVHEIVVLSVAARSQGLSSEWLQALVQRPVSAELEAAASFGRWWFEPESAQLVLSSAAARHLNVSAIHHLGLDDCFIHVVADDMLPLMARLTDPDQGAIKQDFRVVNAQDGLRWLRMSSLPPDAAQPHIVSGILTDITSLKHAAMREHLGFELMEFLVSAHSLDAAVSNVIQLICKNLDWEWGAYWALEPSPQGAPQLACKNFWHHPNHDLALFSAESASLFMAPGAGLIGRVWQNGEAGWVEDMANDPHFLRRASARECRLWSGYAFPVTCVSEDGHQERPGVLEFYSSSPSRQPEAQLLKLSATIGALIAQTAQRLEQRAI